MNMATNPSMNLAGYAGLSADTDHGGLRELSDVGGPAQPLLLVQGLTKHFAVRGSGGMGELFGGLFGGPAAKVHAVDRVNLAVRKGETLGVVGESGCGKSTLAKLIARLLEPDSGELIFDGQGVAQFGGLALKDFRRSVQMVFQDSYASLNPRMPIAEAIAYGPQVHGLDRRQAYARAYRLLDRVGLAPALYAHRYPHELSGGQRQRVNIARALAFEPRLLILDEAVAALDKSVQAQVLNLLQELKVESGLTYLFISHDLQVVRHVADRVVVMYLGQVVESGPVEAIYSNPRHPYTQALLSAVPSMDPARRTERAPLQGDPPNPVNPPSGCRFRDRCPQARQVCELRIPLMREAPVGTPDHFAACHFDPAFDASEPPDWRAAVAATVAAAS